MAEDSTYSMSIESILEKIKGSAIIGLIKDSTLLLTREQWAAHLGVTRVTLLSWEKNLIAEIPFLAQDYFVDLRRRRYLDNYQRFVLALIFYVKQLDYPLGRSSHKSTKTFLRLQSKVIKRHVFEQVIKYV